MKRGLLKRFKQLEDSLWELPVSYRKKMKVPVRVVASENILEEMDDGAVDQAVNVAQLPGIVGASLLMPDAHWGYGMPVGGVAAFDIKEGVISPGAVGYDINCGMRLLITDLTENQVRTKIERIVNELFEVVPAGVGKDSKLKLENKGLEEVMVKGAGWAVKNGYGWDEDLEHIEANGNIDGADPEKVSDKAVKRGNQQLGTLGSGNHYLEIQEVGKIFDGQFAESVGIRKEGQVGIMIHCGSRGFGHQIATDYLNVFEKKMDHYDINIPDKQLACLPIDSKEGKDYYSAMVCAANFAFANRQIIGHRVREIFAKVFDRQAEDLDMRLVYDVAHNIAKTEKHKIPKSKLETNHNNSKSKLQTNEVLVHRKGATRSFPDQPVIIGGSMETGSYLLKGAAGAMEKTFGSTAHGSGRTMSRTQAKKRIRGRELQKRMQEEGILVKASSTADLSEEAGYAYKDINEVVDSLTTAGVSYPVASFQPIGNIKG